MNRLLVVTSLPLLAAALACPAVAQNECERAETSTWVAHTYAYVVEYDVLARYAIERFGESTRCSGQVTTAFDGNDFGSLRLDFNGGRVFRVDTFPPESSSATLTDSTGFKDEDEILETLRRYAAGIGLEIDWSDPIEEIDRDYRTVSFWDPDEGLNASAQLVYNGGTLISVGLSLAL